MSTAIDLACGLAKKFEGFRAKPYICPAGVPTIGYGSTRYLDGKKVTMQDAYISEPDAEKLLRDVMARCLREACVVCPDLAKESEGRQAAIADFVYNLGVARLESSTLAKKINAGLWDDVPAQLRRWVYAGAVVLEGLRKRREAEIELI